VPLDVGGWRGGMTERRPRGMMAGLTWVSKTVGWQRAPRSAAVAAPRLNQKPYRATSNIAFG
jgi:hypothetical protein